MCGKRIVLLIICLQGNLLQAFSLPLTEHQEFCGDRLQHLVRGDVLNGWRVINHLWRLPLDEFTNTWTALIALYLSNHEELMSERKCYQFVQQCRNFHQFFGGLLCDPITQILAYHPQGMEVLPVGELFFPIFSFWHETNEQGYRFFYLIYFDALSRLFVKKLYVTAAAQELITDRQLDQAEMIYSELVMVHKHLIGSRYEARYARQLVRYHELLALLNAERNKLMELKGEGAAVMERYA